MSTSAIASSGPQPGCPVWCADPHGADEPHFGPCADLNVTGVRGTPLLMSLDADYDGRDLLRFTTKTPGWLVPTGEPFVITPDQVVTLRDMLEEFLALTGHAAARPR
ncbi:hypothetical protein LO762_02825 [Actinocorallia sp. API 0066]|uniref:hypothetical protein n=1 Tax=Actinocorallia sp. API 0066 TaxID=2896846 RepID=UPI001E352C67|nr:hypothetical protein [Actinocorallia sp. API 0066]MCD0448135.1 hypothetical protein [Actinocorallia sp. API 0066]